MRRTDFTFDLPEKLIAQKPTTERTASRLLVLDGETGGIEDKVFSNLLDYLQAGDVLVFNNTEVIPARLHGKKASGGKIEVLVERIIDEYIVHAHIRASKSPKVGTQLIFDYDISAEVTGREGDLFVVKFTGNKNTVLEVLDKIGHMPLPPYIQREDEFFDQERYQTVYAEKPGAVAAPTAGLHFDNGMLQQLSDRGVEQIHVTLHVGAGTFQPVRVDDLNEHHMHKEWIELTKENCEKINKAKQEGRRIIAVGTTSVRCLESAALFSDDDSLKPYTGETDIFITPGYEFKVIDALVTNFHLSESTLLMLVSAFAGYENIKNAYQHAIKEKYRFFSYGDAMFMTRNKF